MSDKKKLVIEFDNIKAREHFEHWLCGQGEQDYWVWMECREQEESGNITAKSFDYGRYDGHIKAYCGRMDSLSTGIKTDVDK